jgi:hypothetical protein
VVCRGGSWSGGHYCPPIMLYMLPLYVNGELEFVQT